MIKSKKSCKNWKKVGSNFEKFDEKFDLKFDSNLNLKKFQIQAKLIWIWIWKIFKLDSNLNPIWVSFLIRSYRYFAKFECLRTWQVYNT